MGEVMTDRGHIIARGRLKRLQKYQLIPSTYLPKQTSSDHPKRPVLTTTSLPKHKTSLIIIIPFYHPLQNSNQRFYNSNIMSTSLQNIITHQSNSLHQSELHRLFQRKTYPQFQLNDFHNNRQLMGKEDFAFFIKILEKWNQDAKRQVDSLSDCRYTKNDFIFSWLKSLAVLDDRRMDASLRKLYQWFNSSKLSEPLCFLKKQPSNKSHLQEWQIRNSYKSNLPLEIDTYKRRFIINDKPHPDSRFNQTVDHSPDKENVLLISPCLRQNNYLKSNRQEEEVKEYLNNYKKSKVCFYKNMAKNYYRNQFQRDKLSTASNFYQRKEKLITTDEIKSYRIKTTTGARPFYASSMNKTTSFGFDRSHSPDNLPLKEEPLKLPLSNINGMGLMGNPFQVKLRKKKK